ncbi:MAG: Nif3-like dinuclear metal center hexameric protein [Mycoplasma sp.]
MKVSKICKQLETLYPFKSQEEWDQCRIDLFNDQEITNILITLDVTKEVVELAINKNVNLIITHHPLFLNDGDGDSISLQLYKLLKKNKINAMYLHTPFDKSPIGMNTYLANLLKLESTSFGGVSNDYIVGSLTKQKSLKHVAKDIKKKLSLDSVKYLKCFEKKPIKTIAICSGSGSSLMDNVSNNKIDLFITGDMKYHSWVDSKYIELPIIDVSHEIENVFIDIIYEQLIKLNVCNTNLIKFKNLLGTIII